MGTNRDISDLTGKRAALYTRVSKDRYDDKKSTVDQEQSGRAWAAGQGAVIADVYADPDISASRFANKKNRPQFERMLADIALGNRHPGGKIDVVWFWELSRSQRRLGVFASLRDLSREHGVLWVIRDRVYDMDSYADVMTLGMLSVIAENESEMNSLRVRRGKESLAMRGRADNMPPYGYTRTYDSRNRRFISQDPDVYDGDGRPVIDSPAWVVRQIIEQYAAGRPLTRITEDLNRRGLLNPRGLHLHRKISALIDAGEDPASGTIGKLEERLAELKQYGWGWSTVRRIIANPAYIARRVHQGKVVPEVVAQWPPLVEEDVFWAAQRRLSDTGKHGGAGPPRGRPGGGRYLLSGIARCGECGEPMVRITKRMRHQTRMTEDWTGYICSARYRHVAIKESHLDTYAERIMRRWLSDPEVYTELLSRADSPAAVEAQADADRARTELEQCRHLAEAGEISLVLAGRREKELLRHIEDAEQRVAGAALPAELAGNIGPHAAEKWDHLDLAIQRQIIRTVADISVRSVGKGRHGITTVPHRVTWTWKLGDGGEVTDPASLPPLPAVRARELLRTHPELSNEQITLQAGYSPKGGHLGPVRRELEDAGVIPVYRRRGRGPAVNHGYRPSAKTSRSKAGG